MNKYQIWELCIHKSIHKSVHSQEFLSIQDRSGIVIMFAYTFPRVHISLSSFPGDELYWIYIVGNFHTLGVWVHLTCFNSTVQSR